MKIENKNRTFKVGDEEIKEVVKIELNKNEMITFIKDNKEYDFVAKEWGYYATPSINGRLKSFGYKTAIVKNSYGKLFINVVEEEKIDKFYKYLEKEKSEVVKWLDEHLN